MHQLIGIDSIGAHHLHGRDGLPEGAARLGGCHIIGCKAVGAERKPHPDREFGLHGPVGTSGARFP